MPTELIKRVARPLRVLLIEDYEEDALLLERFLRKAGYGVTALRVETAEELRLALSQPEPWHLALADYTLPTFGARDALAIIQQTGIDLPFIIVSGTVDEVTAVSAMRAGAHDYVLKGHLDRLLPAIERELDDAEKRAERLRTEHELRLVQSRFTATFDQAVVGMAHTSRDLRLLLVNRKLQEMLGADENALVSRRLDEFIAPGERMQDRIPLLELLSGARSGYRVEHRLERRDGTSFPAQLTASIIQPDVQTPPTILWVVEDITQRKAAERKTAELMTRLINSERLAAAGRMANTLAHEINNPLEALTNIVYLLSTFEVPGEAQDLVAMATRELERVGHITRSTLSFYRKEPGKTLDLRTMLEEVVHLYKSRAEKLRAEVVTHFADRAREVRFDPELRQVFANLLGNALEALGNSETEELRRIVIRARVESGSAWVVVSDSGRGIEVANRDAVFEPFFTTKGERGTGLGLWVTRGIVEEQGGSITLKTRTEGRFRGTLVRICLPLKGQ